MKNDLLKTIGIFGSLVSLFFVLSVIYFSPALEGKQLVQSDVNNYKGMAKEISDFKTHTGETALWTNSMFGGMPSYLIHVPSGNLVKFVHKFVNLNNWRPVGFVFVYLLGFFIAMLLMGVNPWLSAIGSVAFAFSSYFFIIIGVGHLTKAMAIGYMPAIIASLWYAYHKKRILGSVLFSTFFSLQLLVNHLQITYYTGLIILIFLIFLFVDVIKKKEYLKFVKTSLFLFIGIVFAIGSNFDKLYTTYEYGKESIRGKSELTINEENQTTGLDKDYATAWSYGIDETLTLLIPNFKGGSSSGELSKDSETYNLFKQSQGAGYAKQAIKHMPLYWGTQPFTEGPVYVGAFIMFMFIFGLFFLKGKMKWWLLTATILSIFLAWGRNFMFLTDLFLDFFPGYNKFRTVAMILVIAELTIPLLAILSLKKIVENNYDKKELIKSLKYSLYIVGGICLFFALLPGAFYDFSSIGDQRFAQGGTNPLADALQQDRKSLLQQDAFRSLIFILLGVVSIWLYINKKIKLNYFYIIIGLIVLIDLWSVNKRYLNDDNFIAERKAETPYLPTNADRMILQDKDPDFRVFNVAVNTFNDASTSYFHKSIGGYHGAKMRRYQELIDFHISQNNMDVLDMLNTKYFIVPNKEQGPIPQRNPGALGNAWFVDEYTMVESADSEIVALSDFNPASELIVDKRWGSQIKDFKFSVDSTRNISLAEYKPNHLKYESNAATDQIAVFSEIFYDKGWNAFIDGIPSDHFRCNYVLRGMVIPAGKHVVEFKFEPKSYYIGNKISLVSSILLLVLLIVVLYVEVKPLFVKE